MGKRRSRERHVDGPMGGGTRCENFLALVNVITESHTGAGVKPILLRPERRERGQWEAETADAQYRDRFVWERSGQEKCP